MAEQTQNPGSSTNTFTKGMVKDFNDTFVGEGLWTHARNAVNNSHDGQVGVVGNEPANLLCIQLPYTLIGCIHLSDDQWAVFTTDDVNSEIGIFDESACSYKKIINDPCLNFNRSNLITGAYRKRYDCERLIYWDDARNPSRFMDIDNPPLKTRNVVTDGCITEVPLTPIQLDCEAIRLAALVTTPCINLSKGKVGGLLPNGSYQAVIAYTIAGVKVTDYLGISEVQSLFSHENTSSSLEITITSIDTNFDEFELAILSNINNQSTAKKIGVYSTSQGTIYLDKWSTEYETIPVSQIVVRKESVDKTDAMYTVNDYLIRIGTTSKFKFNYQPQANAIKTSWVAVQYPADYYYKGGNNTGYMRDEQYAFFIRWVYNTGDKSESYHIPGRVPAATDRDPIVGGDAYETVGASSVSRERWQVENTATIDSVVTSVLADGGKVIATGQMGYWESEEKYPDRAFNIWGNLCGKKIRHHKMPDNTIVGGDIINHFASNAAGINILGVKFDNITHPLDNAGNPILSIIGYEILRGSREGNKSVIAKGMLNNMREYDLPGNPTVKGLYQNYPYNDLRPDLFLTSSKEVAYKGYSVDNKTAPLTAYKNNTFSFHSPETTFSNPFMNVQELKVYQEIHGKVEGKFTEPFKHPKFKLANNFLSTVTDILVTIESINNLQKIFSGDGGITISATENFPISLNYKIPKPPEPADGVVGGILFVARLALWGVTAAAVIGLEKKLADLRKEKVLSMFLYLVPKKQYALQYLSHAFYNNSTRNIRGNIRKQITDSSYIRTGVHGFGTGFRVNNFYRNQYVILQTSTDLLKTGTQSGIVDNTRQLYHDLNIGINDTFISNTVAYYGAIKIPMVSQYGQLDSIKQLPLSSCVQFTQADKTKKYSSDIYFGGDTYINRFTERNTMFYFNTWLMGEPDEIEFDYRNHFAMTYPRYWLNSKRIDAELLTDISREHRHLNGSGAQGASFYVKNRHFYLFNSGVRDFFVESEINVGYRDYDDQIERRFYDPYGYGDIDMMFRSDVVKSGEIYKYDYSLSISKLFNSHISWGNILPRDYDPTVAEKCYLYNPNRAIYSLPQSSESKKDNWRIYLANNYKEFSSPVTSIKSVNKTGALFMMKRQSPLQFMGVEELKLDATGAKITIGDGALFSGPQQLQSLVNSDKSYEYGSCQNKYATLGCTHGVFWVSQDQGKVFQYTGQMKEISKDGMKWWFSKYLPSELLKSFPTYPLSDNPVKGVGVQMIFDNTNEIVYITKKDYKPVFTDLVLEGERFYRLINGAKVYYNLDSEAFQPASWTMSYDPKSQVWLSFHDWIPTFLIPGKAHFMSVNKDSIWKHNLRCDMYTNFYGVDYPFEIEFVSATGQTVNSMRNIEYILEAYKSHNNCADKYHVLDENFDQAIVYNSEQVSGLLELVVKNKTNPLDMLAYPQVGTQSIKINFSKEENKYRFNQFWDITKNRGEFTANNVPMFVTRPNGYQFNINPQYVNYQKPALEHKKFRHNSNRVFLRKLKSNDVKLLFKISNLKLQQSPR
jgi:hypothetical protein